MGTATATATIRRIGLCLVLPAVLTTACTSTQKAPEGSSLPAVKMASSPELATAVSDFREARYQESFDRARALARSSATPLKEQSAWVAGLSAYQLSRLDEAELQFMTSARSQDQRLALDSKIMMGDIRVLQNRWNDAAQCYRDAAKGLSGEERSRVLSYADVSSSRASSRAGGQSGTVGSPSQGSSPTVASSGSAGRSANPPAGSKSSLNGFALQAGAFQNETNARRRAAEIASSVRSAGLGEPRIVRTRDPTGREFWAVQVGTFASRESAEAAKSKTSSLGLIVIAAG